MTTHTTETRCRPWTAPGQDQTRRCCSRCKRLLLNSKFRLCQPALLRILPRNQHGYTARRGFRRTANTATPRLVPRTNQIRSSQLSSQAGKELQQRCCTEESHGQRRWENRSGRWLPSHFPSWSRVRRWAGQLQLRRNGLIKHDTELHHHL